MLDSIFNFSSIINGTITINTFLICSAVSLVLGFLTALVYLFKNRCSQSFAVTLVLLPVIVQTVIMLVNGNIGAGVAVAGAFSLVRFRSAAGSAKEILAVFLSMAVGLATGMGYVTLAVVFFAVTAVCMLILGAVKFGEGNSSLRTLKITIPENLDYDGVFDDLFAAYTNSAELQYTISLKGEEVPKEFIDEIRVRNGNLNITCAKYAVKEAL